MFARIRACLDSCPHCGIPVCRADSGSIRKDTCIHHGWSCGLAVAMVSEPKRPERAEPSDTTARDPAGAPYAASPHRLVLGTRNPERVPLGAVARYRDAMSDHADQGAVVVGGVHERELEDDWKPAPCELGQSPYVRSRSSAAALCLGGVAERSQA